MALVKTQVVCNRTASCAGRRARALCAAMPHRQMGARWATLTLLLALCATWAAHAHSPAQRGLPSGEELSQWGGHFKPGYYDIRAFKLDSKGLPIAESVQKKRFCYQDDDSPQGIQALAHLPVVTMVTNQCALKGYLLTHARFEMLGDCAGDGQNPSISMSVALVVSPNGDGFAGSVTRTVKHKKGVKVLSSQGASAQYLGECVEPLPRAQPS